MSTDTINQHYVPKAYLKQFANAKEQIWVYDKHKRKKFQTHIRNVAAERFFYDTEQVRKITGDKQFVEKYLCNVEGTFENLMRTLPGTFGSLNFRGIGKRDKHFLSIYMVLQMLRTKEHRIRAQQHAEILQAVIMQACDERGLDPHKHPQFDGTSAAELARDMQAEQLLDGGIIQEFSGYLREHIWVVNRVHAGDAFLTSDEPFVKRAWVRHPVRSMSGIRSKGIEIAFPLNPRYVLSLCERTHFTPLGLGLIEGEVLQQTCTENTIYHNYMQIRHSNRYLFSSTDNFSLVETVLNEEPHLGELDRVRVATSWDDKLGRASGIHQSAEVMRQAGQSRPSNSQ